MPSDSQHDHAARLLAAEPALVLDEWTLELPALELLVAEICAGRREIAECGSGLSTVLIARLLAELGEGRLHSLEHDLEWAASVRDRLASQRLDRWARIIDAPLAVEPLAAPGCEWYERAALDQLPRGIELLLIDGPPAYPETNQVRARFPALPLLAGRLAGGATVILDDAGRQGERWALGRWSEELGVEFEDRGRIAVARM